MANIIRLAISVHLSMGFSTMRIVHPLIKETKDFLYIQKHHNFGSDIGSWRISKHQLRSIRNQVSVEEIRCSTFCYEEQEEAASKMLKEVFANLLLERSAQTQTLLSLTEKEPRHNDFVIESGEGSYE